MSSREAEAVPAHKPARNGWGPLTRSTDAITSRNVATLRKSDGPQVCPMGPNQITRILSPISKAAVVAVANCQRDPC